MNDRKKPSLLSVVIGIVCILSLISIGVFIFRYRTVQENSFTDTPSSSSEQKQVEAVTAAAALDVAPFSTPLATLTPTSTPVTTTQDVSLKPNSGSVTRYYNNGTGKGFVAQAAVSPSPQNPSYDSLSSYWETEVHACTTILVKTPISSSLVPISSWLNSSAKTTKTYEPLTTFQPNVEYRFCTTLPATSIGDTAGQHTVHFQINESKAVKERTYDNNTLDTKYTVLRDAIAPTFTIFGPHVEVEGTCMHLNDIADNISTNAQMTIEHRLDNGAWGPSDASRQCIQGPAGEQHTYSGKVTDAAGNITERSQVFTIQ